MCMESLVTWERNNPLHWQLWAHVHNHVAQRQRPGQHIRGRPQLVKGLA